MTRPDATMIDRKSITFFILDDVVVDGCGDSGVGVSFHGFADLGE